MVVNMMQTARNWDIGEGGLL